MIVYTLSLMLILVMDPLGNVPVFTSILKKFAPRTQVKIILRESFIAFIVLLIFLYAGRYILRGLHVSTAALSISGSIILFIIAIRMIFPSDKSLYSEEELEEPLIVPLAVPLTAGPSTLTVLVLYSTQHPDHTLDMLAAVVISCVVFTLIMLASRYLMRLLGRRVLIAIERLMGMILTMISVQMFLSGVMEYLNDSQRLMF